MHRRRSLYRTHNLCSYLRRRHTVREFTLTMVWKERIGNIYSQETNVVCLWQYMKLTNCHQDIWLDNLS